MNKVAVGYERRGKFFGTQEDKVVVTGNPIRPEIMLATREEGVRALGLDGGKLRCWSPAEAGAPAASIRRWSMFTAILPDRSDMQILHVTGQSEYNNIVGLLQAGGIDIAKTGNIIIMPYLYNMPQALAAADMAVFRAGAVGLAELTARGIPAILFLTLMLPKTIRNLTPGSWPRKGRPSSFRTPN